MPGPWKNLHRCQDGGVQSLALVLTMPLLVGTLLLVIQLAQILVAVMTVQYAAFAASRSAVVWVTSATDDSIVAGPNEILTHGGAERWVEVSPDLRQSSRKYREIYAAAAQACVAIAPARQIAGPRADAIETDQAVEAFLVFQQLQADPREGRWRLAVGNRWSYAFANTQVRVKFAGQPRYSPTYNPVDHPVREYDPREVGWDESVTAVVRHEVAILPGPGRWLFQQVAWGSATGDASSGWSGSGRSDRVPVYGSTTLTLAGIKSNHPVSYPWREE